MEPVYTEIRFRGAPFSGSAVPSAGSHDILTGGMETNEPGEMITSPVYMQIALDVASRIERGELAVNTKLYGRSVMSSEYGVSPETIRRSLKLLSDMGVVNVQHNSGAVVLSRDKAVEYVARFSEYNDVKIRRKKLRMMIRDHIQQTRDMLDLVNEITGADDRVSRSNPFRNYEIDIPENSHTVGKTIGELQFWQETGATVIAVRRGGKIILSPGPYIRLESFDTIIFVGDTRAVAAVSSFIDRP